MPDPAKPLFPVPKVYVPFIAGIITVLGAWAVTGSFDKTELVGLVTTFLLAAIGYATPHTAEIDEGPFDGDPVEPTPAVPDEPETLPAKPSQV